tara:strand:+ start:830 stop:2986 length:2157 start_codon:yes stop_codon:yes gene_type:complete
VVSFPTVISGSETFTTDGWKEVAYVDTEGRSFSFKSIPAVNVTAEHQEADMETPNFQYKETELSDDVKEALPDLAGASVSVSDVSLNFPKVTTAMVTPNITIPSITLPKLDINIPTFEIDLDEIKEKLPAVDFSNLGFGQLSDAISMSGTAAMQVPEHTTAYETFYDLAKEKLGNWAINIPVIDKTVSMNNIRNAAAKGIARTVDTGNKIIHGNFKEILTDDIDDYVIDRIIDSINDFSEDVNDLINEEIIGPYNSAVGTLVTELESKTGDITDSVETLTEYQNTVVDSLTEKINGAIGDVTGNLNDLIDDINTMVGVGHDAAAFNGPSRKLFDNRYDLEAWQDEYPDNNYSMENEMAPNRLLFGATPPPGLNFDNKGDVWPTSSTQNREYIDVLTGATIGYYVSFPSGSHTTGPDNVEYGASSSFTEYYDSDGDKISVSEWTAMLDEGGYINPILKEAGYGNQVQSRYFPASFEGYEGDHPEIYNQKVKYLNARNDYNVANAYLKSKKDQYKTIRDTEKAKLDALEESHTETYGVTWEKAHGSATGISGAFGAMGMAVNEGFDKMTEGISDSMEDVSDQLNEGLSGIFGGIEEAINFSNKEMAEKVDKKFEALDSALKEVFGIYDKNINAALTDSISNFYENLNIPSNMVMNITPIKNVGANSFEIYSNATGDTPLTINWMAVGLAERQPGLGEDSDSGYLGGLREKFGIGEEGFPQ